jgi:hypothetical protein
VAAVARGAGLLVVVVPRVGIWPVPEHGLNVSYLRHSGAGGTNGDAEPSDVHVSAGVDNVDVTWS